MAAGTVFIKACHGTWGMDCVVLDGSRGGGQMVRTALALSCITGREVAVTGIRQGRRVPGLGAQHLAAAGILRDMCGASMEGDRVGSSRIRFRPGTPRDTAVISRDVGTAGSIPLVLQAAIPACWALGMRLDLTVTGGTDVRWAPTADYTRHVMAAAYHSMGLKMEMAVLNRGYYPRGGGRIRVTAQPSTLKPAAFTGGPGEVAVTCTFSGMDRGEVSRAVRPVSERLAAAGADHTTIIREEPARDRGAAILVYGTGTDFAGGEDSLYPFDASLGDAFAGIWGVDAHLSDMLVVPASVAEGTSVFRVGRITRHLENALYAASRITGCRYGASETAGGFEVRVEGIRRPRP